MFKPVTVFDISQTDGKPMPVLAETLVGNVQNYDIFMEAVKQSSPVPIVIEPMQENMDGYGRTFLFSCYVAAYRWAIIIQIMCYDVKFAKHLTIFGTTENENQQLQKKFSYLLGHFQRNLNGQK